MLHVTLHVYAAGEVSQELYDPRYHTQDTSDYQYHHDRHGIQRHSDDGQPSSNWYQQQSTHRDPEDTGCMCTCPLPPPLSGNGCTLIAPRDFLTRLSKTVATAQTGGAVLTNRKGAAAGERCPVLSNVLVQCNARFNKFMSTLAKVSVPRHAIRIKTRLLPQDIVQGNAMSLAGDHMDGQDTQRRDILRHR